MPESTDNKAFPAGGEHKNPLLNLTPMRSGGVVVFQIAY